MLEFLLAQARDYRLIAKYIISGSIAAVSQLGMLVFLVERVHVWHLLAVVYAFFFSASIAFCLQKFWTFNDRSMRRAHFQAALYAILILIALSLNVLLMYIFVDIFQIWYVIAQIITMGMVTVVTFLSNKYIVFGDHEAMPFFKTRIFIFFKTHKIVIGVFLLAVLARLVFFFICLHANGGDLITTIRGQDGYFQLSRNLLLGNGFSINSEQPFLPYSYGVPGYPFFLFGILWLTGSYAVTGMTQLILGATIPVLGMYLTRLIVPSFRNAPLVVGLLLAFSPYQILFSFIFYTETLFTVIFGLFLIVFLNFLKTPSTKLALATGLLLGIATLVKPTVQYLALVVIIFSLWHFRGNLNKKQLIRFGLLLSAFLLVMSPWLYRNYETFGAANLSSQMPFNLHGVLLPSVLAIANSTSFSVEQAKLPIYLDLSLSEMSALSARSIKEIAQHPVALIELSALSAFTFFTHDGMLTFLQAAGVSPVSFLQKPALIMLLTTPWELTKSVFVQIHTSMGAVLLARIFWVVMTVFFGVGLYRLWRERLFSGALVFVSIIVFYFMLTTMINGLAVNARFRMPVEPIIFAIAYSGLMLSYRSIKK
ncbi:MAG: GtrA family protein [bacterium]|nr:GtrA family protein [bacterium]